MRVVLTGGIPLRSLRMAEAEGDLEYPVYDTWQDTWPLDDLIHDIVSLDYDSEYDALGASLQVLRKSAAAQHLIMDAHRQGWEMGLSDLGEAAFHLDVPSRKIIINNHNLSPSALMRSAYFKNLVLVSITRALRDVWHEKRHGGFDEKFAPESVLMLERVRAADCDVISVLAAWQLREAGEGDLWRHMLASDEGDLAIAFGCVLEKDSGDYAAHKGLGAAFTQWYATPDRAMMCDHETLEYLDEVIRSGAKIGSQNATASDIEALACLPDRTTYLQGRGADILRAPQYAGLHDAVNQSHFMQIMHDMQVTYVQGIPFRDAKLASLIFPNGEMTPETEMIGRGR